MATETSFQSFAVQTRPQDGPPRLTALRSEMKARGVDAFIVPRTDAHQGEYVTDRDARLRWLSGFSGSAGYAIATAEQAGVFVDGRYRVQVKGEVDLAYFTPVNWPEVSLAAWLCKALPQGGRVAYDPWLHSRQEIRRMIAGLTDAGISLNPGDNLIDAIWTDRPAAASGPVRLHDEGFAGRSSADKRAHLAEQLHEAGASATVLNLADSIAWLLNIRGADVQRNPVVQGIAVVDDQGHVQLYSDPAKFGPEIGDRLGGEVSIFANDALPAALRQLQGPVLLDPSVIPDAVFALIEEGGNSIVERPDPVILSKAIKNPAELDGMRAAHRRDAVAMVGLLAWLEGQQLDGSLDEIGVVRKLESLRRAAGAYDISFDTICSTGPNAAINHYHVDEQSNLPLKDGDLLLLDSGGQYDNGTTDITRTIPLGDVPDERRLYYTLVLRGMINLSRLRFPRGMSGRDLDPVARSPLWTEGLDFDHGTGHGVGAALCVHEGPARISRISEISLQPGMILSNEPGYYREGAFGIRIENLLAIIPADSPDGRDMLGFETLTLVPINRRLIDADQMSGPELDWLNAYHARVWDEIGPLVRDADRDWLRKATEPLTRS